MRRWIVKVVVALLFVQVAVPSIGSVEASPTTGTKRIVNVFGNGIYPTVMGNPEIATDVPLPGLVKSMVADSAGNLYVASQNEHRIYKIDPQGKLSTYFGPGNIDDAPVSASSSGTLVIAGSPIALADARLDSPSALAIDSDGNLYIAESNSGKVLKVDKKIDDVPQMVTLVVGGGTDNTTDTSITPIAATALKFRYPVGMAFDKDDNLYIVYNDSNKGNLMKVNNVGEASSQITTLLSLSYPTAPHDYLTGVGVDKHGNIFISEQNSGLVHKIDPFKNKTLYAGKLSGVPVTDGLLATEVNIGSPYDMKVDSDGNVYVASYSYDQVYKIDTDQKIHILVGKQYGTPYQDGDVAKGATIGKTDRLAIGKDGEVYVRFSGPSRVAVVQDSYLIEYDGNGSDGGNAPARQVVKVGASTTTAGNAGTLTKDIHMLSGWKDGSGTSYPVNSSITPAADVTLYAQWEPAKYTLTFTADSNGTLTSGEDTLKKEIIFNNVAHGANADSVTAKPNSGYAFVAWSDKVTSAVRLNLNVTSDLDITATFAKEHTVTFVTYGGTSIASQTILNGQLLNAVTNPTKGTYTFDGWYTNEDLTAEIDITTTEITNDLTLYAKWTMYYTVSVNSNNGTPVSSLTVTEATYLSPPVSPLHTGYTFDGWYSDDDFTNEFDFDATEIMSDMTIYAKWDINSYTVSFNTNGGAAISSQPVDYNKLVSGPITTTLDGYTFMSWYTDTNFGTPFDISATAITGDTQLYAKWELTPPGAPTILSATPNNAKVDIAWTAVPYVSQYKVYQSTTSGALGSLVATVTDSVYSYEATGLTNGVTYYYVVAAVNNSGENNSIKVNATPRSVAAAPTNVTATAGNRQAEISFTAPADNGGSTITSYRVTVLPDNRVVTTTSTSLTVTGLTNGTAYTFTVEAYNALGYGAVSAPSNGVTPIAPIAPIDNGNSGGNNGGSTGGGATNSGSVNTPLVTTDGAITVPAGMAGETKLNDAIIIKIPAGVTDQELKVTIEQLSNIDGLTGQGEVLASPVYELLKNFSENFIKPITLTFKFDVTKVNEGQYAAIFYYDEDTNQWVEVGGTVDGENISADVDHFTKFAVLVVDKQATELEEASYSDILGHWAAAKITDAVQQGIVNGYPDGTFKPNATITRAEFSMMLANALKLTGEGALLSFIDKVKIGAWANNSVAQAVEAGILSGYSDGSFRPGADITRTELAAMVARAYSSEAAPSGSGSFADESEIPAWAKDAVSLVKSLGIVNGKSNNRFAPRETATRAEAVTMIINLLQVKK